MARIHVNRFLGIAPKLGATLLNNSQAQVAKNARLWSETLRPVAGVSTPELLPKTGEIKTIWRYDDDTAWLAWTQDVDVVRTPIAGDTLEKIYFTGTDKPRVTTKDLYNAGSPGTSVPPASYILGIPAPDQVPVPSDTGAGNLNGTFTWVFTFVRKWSDGTADEGPPSPPSTPALALVNRQVSVTLPNGAMATPTDYGITHKRLYRSAGGLFFFVAEVAIGTSPTTDNIATANLGTELLTTRYLPPPDDMIGIIELANGVLAGFKGNVVYLSEPHRPWAFPSLNQYTVSWPVVAIGGFGTTIIVGTQGYPYVGRGVDPASYSFKPQVGANYPCISKRSMAAGEVGVFWATNDGVALANPSGVTLATREFLTHIEWRRDYAPSTMHGIVHEGRYYGWFSTGTDASGNKIGGGIVLDRTERAFLTTLARYVEAAYVSPSTGEMWIATKNSLGANYAFTFDADLSLPEQYEWKSKVFVANGLDNFSHAQIIANFGAGLSPAEIAALAALRASIEAYNATQVSDGEINDHLLNGVVLHGDSVMLSAPSTTFTTGSLTFQYWADGVLKLSRSVSDSNPFPLPAGFRSERHEFAVSGAVEVTQVTLASSVEELASV